MAPPRLHVRRLIFVLLFALCAAVPTSTFAAGFFGPIVPATCHCDNQTVQGAATGSTTSGSTTVTSAPDYGCVLLVIQNLVNIGVSLGVILMVIWIAYAGFSLMVSGGSAEARSQGKTRVTNAFVGIIVILAAWLIVNFIMGILYNGQFGDWNGILAGNGNDTCIQARQSTPITLGSILSNLTTVAPDTTSSGSGNGGYGTSGQQCAVANQACSVSTLEGYGLTSSQANVMSCIAVTESSGNPAKPPYNQSHPGSNSTACGTFQITQTTWNGTASGACSSFSNCMNPTCNAQVAATLVQKSGYSSWTCPNCNSKAQGCVVQYSGT